MTDPRFAPRPLSEHIASLGETWRLEAGLRMIARSGHLAPCTACHRELNQDEVLAIPVNFKVRSNSNLGGMAHGSRLIRLHPVLLTERFREKLVETTFHELVHCIDTLLGQRSHHGAHWWWVFAQFGFYPTRTHSLNLRTLGNPLLEEIEL